MRIYGTSNNPITFNAKIKTKRTNQIKHKNTKNLFKENREELLKTDLNDKKITANKISKKTHKNHKISFKILVKNKTSPQYFSSFKNGQVSQEDFSALIPKEMLTEQKGNPKLWEFFDESVLDELLLALDRDEITSIVTQDGTVYPKMVFSSTFERKLYENSQDLKKAKIIAQAYERHLEHSNLTEAQKYKLQQKLIKYTDYIGVRQGNIKKILKQSPTLDFLTQNEWEKSIRPFLAEISIHMKDMLKELNQEDAKQATVTPEQVVITTTASGGAHLSIARVIQESLDKRNIPHVVVNESHLISQDKLSQCIGIPRRDLFNKVCQQSDRMSYGKKLKKLDDKLSIFIPDNQMDNFRKAIGNSEIIVSTSHHPDNIRCVAENGKRVCFQVCDYGELPDKLEKIAKTTTKYNLSGITFHAPSKNSSLRVKKGKPLAYPQTKETPASKQEKPIKSQEVIYKNYEHFVRVNRYPVHKAFRIQLSASDIINVKTNFHLRPEARLWVMTMGSQGVGGILEKYIDQVIEGSIKDVERGEFELLDIAILCGANTPMMKSITRYTEQKLQEACANHPPEVYATLQQRLQFKPFPRIDLSEVALLGKASDAYLSKPGGGTTGEALEGEFPMIIHKEEKHPWEFGNIDELLMKGATLLRPGDNFYEAAKHAAKIKSPHPLNEPEQCIDYTVQVLWNIEQARKKVTSHLQDKVLPVIS